MEGKKHLVGILWHEKNRSVGAKPPKGVQIILQILNPFSDTEILTPELVGDQIEMVAL